MYESGRGEDGSGGGGEWEKHGKWTGGVRCRWREVEIGRQWKVMERKVRARGEGLEEYEDCEQGKRGIREWGERHFEIGRMRGLFSSGPPELANLNRSIHL